MEYVQRPLPIISTRLEWQLSSSCPLPPTVARLDRNELRHMLDIGDTKAEPLPVAGPQLSAATFAPSVYDGGHAKKPTPGSAAGQPTEKKSPSTASGSQPDDNLAIISACSRKAPKRGQNLRKYLLSDCGWTKEDFEAVQRKVEDLASKKLNLTVCYTSQRISTRRVIFREVKDAYSVARGYEEDWPMKNMLIALLKRTSESHRRSTGTVKSRQTKEDDDSDDD
ncbi:hypothetical protein C8R43DRAFT_950541 [Mycena crocata]|nr:hypothetical protein C8R43DRAFT_950541 [Mycena crocata]